MLLRVSPLLALAAGAQQDSADSREDITIWNTLQQTFGGVGQVARKKDPQELKVINIGLARTATSSFVTAMRELGIKSYHMKDGVQDSDGHADLWIDHAALALDEADEAKPGWRTDPAVVASRAAVFKKIAEDGFNATADMPMNGYYKELLELYPNALVVLTEHPTGSAERWANSVRATIGRNAELFPQKPFAWIPFMKGFVRMEAWAWQAQGAPRRKGSPPAFDAAELAEFYGKWNAEAEAWVASKGRKLLKFKATDGWKPMCDFMAALGDKMVDAKCAAILASGVPFPAANVDLRTVYAVLEKIVAFFQLADGMVAIAVLATLAVVVLWISAKCFLSCCCRGKKAKKPKKA